MSHTAMKDKDETKNERNIEVDEKKSKEGHPDFILFMLGITMIYDHFLPFLQNFRLWPFERAYRSFLH